MTLDKWAQYHKATSGRNPRKLLVEACAYAPQTPKALDVGAGDLVDSVYLLSEGSTVTAVDSSPSSEAMSREITSPKFTFVQKTFDAFDFKPEEFDLISAQFALPFNNPSTFNTVFANLKNSLKSGGIFTGQFFGVHDEWNTPESTMTFHTLEEVQSLLTNMTVIKLTEVKEVGKTAAGADKQWHIFEVIAKKE